MENCVCILRNLSYHVHKEIPAAERYLEPGAGHLRRAAGPPKKRSESECLGGKKSKGWSVDRVNVVVAVRSKTELPPAS